MISSPTPFVFGFRHTLDIYSLRRKTSDHNIRVNVSKPRDWASQQLHSSEIWPYFDGITGAYLVSEQSDNSNYVSPYQLLITHYSSVIMSAMASQITGVSIVYSTVDSDLDQRKHQSSASLVFVRGIPRWIPLTKGQWHGKCFHLMAP